MLTSFIHLIRTKQSCKAKQSCLKHCVPMCTSLWGLSVCYWNQKRCKYPLVSWLYAPLMPTGSWRKPCSYPKPRPFKPNAVACAWCFLFHGPFHQLPLIKAVESWRASPGPTHHSVSTRVFSLHTITTASLARSIFPSLDELATVIRRVHVVSSQQLKHPLV